MEKSFDMLRAVQVNSSRLAQRFAEARQGNSAWLVECRDLGDAFDEDAGVYFVPCPDEAAVAELVAKCSDDNPYDKLLGIFNLHKPLDAQGGGVTRTQWLAGQR
jgi:hypothetical protein